jgi:hypothetical protein
LFAVPPLLNKLFFEKDVDLNCAHFVSPQTDAQCHHTTCREQKRRKR